MDINEKLDIIRTKLKNLESRAVNTRLADLIGVTQPTIGRWTEGTHLPAAKKLQKIDLLVNTIKAADSGNVDAQRTLLNLLYNRKFEYLKMGVEGFMIAAGLGWALGVDDKKIPGHKT
ncbi:MAG: helix-turn-helix transcriptional regulator [Planctomycetes bacterium]|nr:helix-turn-helix transcriptional regulator [Planctomycetota bacterium]